MSMKKNELFELTITAMSSDGSGIGRVNNIAVFVPFSAIGDVLSVKAVKVTRSLVYGKIERIIKPSPDRIAADCSVFGKCGGCDFRHISYEAELRAKDTFIRDAFTRIGKLMPEFRPIIGSDTERYRNKAQYPVSEKLAGFYARRSHRIIPCDDCKLQPAVFGQIKDFVLSGFSEGIRHICVRKGHYSGEINVCLVAWRADCSELAMYRESAQKIAERFPAVKGVVLNINPNETNVIYGEREIVLFGERDITDTMCGLKVRISPRSFYQVNTPAAEKLYEIIAELAQADDKTVLDLYCGIGTIGLSLAKGAREVIGVEINESSVRNAAENARINRIENARFICGDTVEVFNRLTTLGSQLSIVADPARKGCDSAVLERAAALAPARIVMVSCDPATAARDCKRLGECGYRTALVQGADLFPRTRHVECAVLLHKI
jgi:23S rRNA (uracil1939-C5)-methyltransferase